MILVDKREPPHLLSLIRQQGVDACSAFLVFGDYVWQCPLGLVAVERKTINDLLGSIKSGRAATEFRRTIEGSELPILLVEGKMGEFEGQVSLEWDQGWEKGKWDYDAVSHILLTWQLAGMRLVFCPRAQTTHIRLASLYRYTQKPSHLSTLGAKQKILTLPKKLGLRAQVISSLPHIGAKRSEVLSGQFSLEHLFQLSEEGWVNLMGKYGHRIYSVIHEEPEG